MPELGINEISKLVNGKLVNVNKDLKFIDFHFDTRLINKKNSLFFALKTENNDGHKFIKNIKNKKGIGAVVSKDFVCKGLNIPLIKVEDTLKAAHQLASYVRNKYRNIKYIGITGSAGKTTTKEFIYQILSKKYKVYRASGNWNNWIGLPFSILKMNGDEQIAIFELAMSYPGIGEIDLLSEILKPDVVMILNVFPVHLEFLKNIENIAKAKSEILNYLCSDDVAFITGDSELILRETKNKNGRKVYFGKKDGNNIILRDIKREKSKTRMEIDFYGIKTEFVSNFINLIHIENLFAAIIVSQYIGMKNFEIQEAIKNLTPLLHRGRIKKYKDFTIIDETYNSNPEALKKTLSWVDMEYKKRKIAIIGDMLELGEDEEDFHFDIGKYFSTLNFDFLITVGERSLKIAEGAESGGFSNRNIKVLNLSEEAGEFLKEIVEPDSVILLKASRGIDLTKAIDEFCKD